MNFLGMGTFEILLVLGVAFIFLGPERMVDAARVLGKWVAEARRMASDLPSLDLDDDTPPNRRTASHSNGHQRLDHDTSQPTDSADREEEQASAPDDDGPVAYQPLSQPLSQPQTSHTDEERS